MASTDTTPAAGAAPFYKLFASIKSLAAGTRDEVQRLDARIAELTVKRGELEHATPHVDDLVELLRTNIDRHVAFFDDRARTYLNPDFIESRGWSAFDNNPELWANG